MKSRTLYVIGNASTCGTASPQAGPVQAVRSQATTARLYREIEETIPTQGDWSDLELALANMDVDASATTRGTSCLVWCRGWSDSGHTIFCTRYKTSPSAVPRLATAVRRMDAEAADPKRRHGQETTCGAGRGCAVLQLQLYTSTLGTLCTTVIRIPRTNTVHPRLRRSGRQRTWLGHAWHPLSRKSLNDRPDIEEIDTRLMEANDIIDDYFSATFKRSTELIADHREFFDALTEIEQVIVLGHSLSAVDAAYFTALNEQRSVAEAQWQIACRSSEEWPEKQVLLARLGINLTTATPVLWDALEAP